MRRNRVAWLVLAVAMIGLIWGAVTLAKPPNRDCRFVLCAYPDCLPGEHTEIPPGQCCPVCVPD